MKVNDNREQVEKVSGVRGRKVYELTARRQLVIGLGNSLDKTIQQRFVSPTSPYRSRAHNASLRVVATGGYELLIPASGTEPAVHVPISFYAKPTPLLGGIHGVEQGPAQYKLMRDSSGWLQLKSMRLYTDGMCLLYHALWVRLVMNWMRSL